MIPRDYQRAAVAAAREKTASEGNTLLALATGGGKTVIAGFYIGEEAADDPASRFLVIQHTDELIEQNSRTIDHITGLPLSVVKAERDDWSGRVVFGSVQTLGRANRRERMIPVSHLVIDECHRAAAESYQALIGHARSLRPDLKLLGLSATPERGDGRSLRRTFSSVAYHLPIGALIEQGILVPPRTFTIDLGIGDELAGIDAAAGDFDMRQAIGIGARRLCLRVPCHTTRHAGPHRAVRGVEVMPRAGEHPDRRRVCSAARDGGPSSSCATTVGRWQRLAWQRARSSREREAPDR